MRIDIDDTWSVESDANCYMLVKRTISQSGKSKGAKQRTPVSYYQSLEAAFRGAAVRMHRTCDAQGVIANLQAAQEIAAKVGRLLDSAMVPKRRVA